MALEKKSYSEKLKDPRWQKMRLEIMQRDGFCCKKCGDGTTTLNVHHKYYTNGADPWDYSPMALVTLCEPCHEAEEWGKLGFKRVLNNALELGFYYEHLEWIIDSAYVLRELVEPEELARLLAGFIRQPSSLKIMQDAAEKRSKEFEESLKR